MLSRLHRALWPILAVIALALVFSLYLNPDLVVDLAARMWSCI
jgi:hypothetical protein